MIERLLRECLEGPHRRRIVITLSLALGFFLVWPSVDSLLALREQRAQMQAELEEIVREVARRGQWEQQATERRAALERLEAACMPPERLSVFRGEVVDLARQTSCQIRRINAGESRQRPWKKGDNPLASETLAPAEPKTRFQLRSHVLSMAVSGKLPNVREFLGKLLKLNTLLYGSQFTLRPVEGNESETLLELECILFDLSDEGAKP